MVLKAVRFVIDAGLLARSFGFASFQGRCDAQSPTTLPRNVDDGKITSRAVVPAGIGSKDLCWYPSMVHMRAANSVA